MPKIYKLSRRFRNPDYNDLLKQIRSKVKKLEEIAVSLNYDLTETINSSQMLGTNIAMSANELVQILQTLNQIEEVFLRINNRFVVLKRGF